MTPGVAWLQKNLQEMIYVIVALNGTPWETEVKDKSSYARHLSCMCNCNLGETRIHQKSKNCMQSLSGFVLRGAAHATESVFDKLNQGEASLLNDCSWPLSLPRGGSLGQF